MTKDEIEARLHEIAKELADLTSAVLKCEGKLASRLTLEIINVAGNSSVSLDLQTAGDIGEMAAGAEAMAKYRAEKAMKPEGAVAQAEKLMSSLGKKPDTNVPKPEEPKAEENPQGDQV